MHLTITLAATLLVLLSGPALERGAALASQLVPEPLELSWQRGELDVSLHLSDRAPYVSDAVAVRLQVRAEAGTGLELPAATDFLPRDWEVTDVRQAGPETDSEGRLVWQLTFAFEVLRPGQYELPPVPLRYRAGGAADWHTAATEPVALEFRSLLGDDPDQAAARPNPGPVAWPGSRVDIRRAVALAALVLLAASGLMLAAMRYRRRRARVPRVSPYRKAMDAIDRIARAGWLENGQTERFYTELSGVLRYYVEDRFGLRAPEQTTEEFLANLSSNPVLAADQARWLGRFLQQCDLVKFARERPALADGRGALEAARGFIEATGPGRPAVCSKPL